MAMNPSEMVSFFEEQADLFSQGIEVALSAKDYSHAAFAVSEVHKAQAMAGLIQWRHGLACPVPLLRDSLATAKKAAEFLHRLDSSQEHWKSFPFSSSLHFEVLLFGTSQLRAMLPDRDQCKHILATYPEVCLDSLLVAALVTGDVSEPWQGVLSNLNEKKGLSLMCDTYENYMALVEALVREDTEGARYCVDESARLFSRRRTDSYFSGGIETRGGGEDNSHVVDFVLAAIARYFNADQLILESSQAAVHAWKWSGHCCPR